MSWIHSKQPLRSNLLSVIKACAENFDFTMGLVWLEKSLCLWKGYLLFRKTFKAQICGPITM